MRPSQGWLRKIGTVLVATCVVGVVGAISPAPASAAPTPPHLVSLAVSPATATVRFEHGQGFRALGTYSDGTTRDVTSEATWSSTNPTVVSVGCPISGVDVCPGFATGVDPTASRRAAVIARLDARLASAAVSITPGLFRVDVSASEAASIGRVLLIPGGSAQLHAVGRYLDLSTTDLTARRADLEGSGDRYGWRSSDDGVVTVGVNGLVTGVSPGTATITRQFGSFRGEARVVVLPSEPVSLEVTKPYPGAVVPVGARIPLTAMATLADGSTQDVTPMVDWSAPPGAPFPDERGVYFTSSLGAAQVTATFAYSSPPVTATFYASVAPADFDLASIVVTPATASGPLGGHQLFTATGRYVTPGPTEAYWDISSAATWASSQGGEIFCGSIPGTFIPGTSVPDEQYACPIFVAGAEGPTTISATVAGTTGSASYEVLPPALTALAISPEDPVLDGLGSGQLSLTGTYTDGTTQDLTDSAMWSSTDPTAATVDAHGLASPLRGGPVGIAAKVGPVTAGTTLWLPLQQSSISLTASTTTAVAGDPIAFEVRVTGTDGNGDVTILAGSTGEPVAGCLAIPLQPAQEEGYAASCAIGEAASTETWRAEYSGSPVSTPSLSPGVTVTVTPNASPLASNLDRSVLAGRSSGVALTAIDPDGDPLTFAVTSGPSHGTLTGTAPDLVYTPAVGYAGSDHLGFSVSDGHFTIQRSVALDVGTVGLDRVAGTVPAGGTISTGGHPLDGTPTQVSVSTPIAGSVEITRVTGPSPGGFTVLGSPFQIEAPSTTSADPLRLTFAVDRSLLPAGFDPAGGVDPFDLGVLRNGVPVDVCGDLSGVASPDPCLLSIEADADTAWITALSSQASTWTLAVQQRATQVALAASPTTAAFGDPVTLTATIIPDGSPLPGGSVAFFDTSASPPALLGVSAVQPNRKATLVTSSLPVGGHSIVATFSGTTDQAQSTSAPVAVTVKRIPTTLVARDAGRLLTIGFPKLQATLTRTVGGQPIVGERVDFFVGGSKVCSGTTNTSGVASCTVLVVSLLGTYSARYAGDANRAPSSDSARL